MDEQDKPLENLFRDKAETFSDLSYREEDWTKLEKKLDALYLKKKYRRRVAYLAAASVLFIALMGYFTLSNHYKINEISDLINQLEELQTNNPQPENNELAFTDEQGNNSDLAERKESSVEMGGFPGSETGSDAPGENDRAVHGEAEIYSAKKTDFVDKDVTIDKTRNHILANNSLFHAGYSPMINSVQSFNDHDRPERPDQSSISVSTTGENNGTATVSGAPSGYKSSVSLGIMLSPDLSTAGGLSNFHDPGFKGGVLAEYHFSDRFSIRSGAILSNVRYKAAQNDYKVPAYLNSGLSPVETSAICLILDIPVSLKATLFNLENSNFYVTGGVSTYVMLKEKYQFDFGTNSPPYLIDEWQGHTGDAFWASNVSFSLGYELDISERLALRAEPHVYIPVSEVGWGNVKLYSMGTSVSMNVRM